MESFADNFWGEKNNGFDVLYHNMKNGLQSSRELETFIRECCSIDESYAKLLSKLATHASNYSTLGSFAPYWQVLKSFAEKLSTLHVELVKKWQALIKEVTDYAATQAKIHKAVKESEAGTQETVNAIQQTTTSLYKARETYHARCLEYERLKRENGSQKDLEKAETKYKRAMEDYKGFVEKYSTIRDEFEEKMTNTSKNFQDVEEKHLQQLIDFVDKYADSWYESHASIGQAYQDFRSDCQQFSVHKLVQLFLETKATGREKPGPVEFEEADLSSLPPAVVTPSPEPSLEGQKDDISVDSTEKEKKEKKKREDSSDSLPSPSIVRSFAATAFVSGIFGGRKRDKKKKKKKSSDGGSVDNMSRDSKDTDSIDTWDKELNTPEVDEEGFSIKPSLHNPDHKDATWGFSSDDDSDDEKRKFKVEIKPINQEKVMTANVEDIRNSLGNLRLSPTLARRRNVSRTDVMKSEKPEFSSSNSQNDLLNIDFFAGKASGDSFSPQNDGAWTSARKTPDFLGNNNVEPPPIPPKSNHNPETAFLPGPPTAAARTSRTSIGSQMTARPNGRQSPAIPGVPRAESGSSISTFRGPSPLTIGMADTIPVAVAFTETVNAYFKGSDETKCRAVVTGNLMISFPAGIVRVLTENRVPPALTFRITNSHQLDSVQLNKQLVTQDSNQAVNKSSNYSFNMTALTEHLRTQQERNASASYFNIDILKYTVKVSSGAANTPLKLVTYWKCEPSTTDFRLDYSYNSGAMHKSLPLNNVTFLVPFNGQVIDVQSLPEATWSAESKRAVWKLPDISPSNEDNGVNCLRAKFTVSEQTAPSTVAVQFTCEGTTLSGVDFELAGPGYRLSLGKKRFATGKYFAETDAEIRYV